LIGEQDMFGLSCLNSTDPGLACQEACLNASVTQGLAQAKNLTCEEEVIWWFWVIDEVDCPCTLYLS